jgi:hypothetical protein
VIGVGRCEAVAQPGNVLDAALHNSDSRSGIGRVRGVQDGGYTYTMSDSSQPPPNRAVPPPTKLRDVDSPPPDQVLEQVASKEEIIEDAQSADEILKQQPSVDELLRRDG